MHLIFPMDRCVPKRRPAGSRTNLIFADRVARTLGQRFDGDLHPCKLPQNSRYMVERVPRLELRETHDSFETEEYSEIGRKCFLLLSSTRYNADDRYVL